MTAQTKAYWDGWNDAMLGKRYCPATVDEAYRLDYRAGFSEYLAQNT